MTFFKQRQAIVMVDVGDQYFVYEFIVEFDHSQIIGRPQYFNDYLILIDKSLEKRDVLGFQVFLNEQISLLGDPLWEGQSELILWLVYIFAGLYLFVLGLADEQIPAQQEHLILNDYVNLVIHFYIIQYDMKNWATLIGFCLSNFSNGMGFGIYTDNLDLYAREYQTTRQVMENTFYIGLLIEIFLCVPAIKVIEWRLDYAIISAAYMTACSYYLQYFSMNNVVIVIASLVLNSIGQLLLLPTPLYLAQVWFPLEKRSFVIGVGFYANLLGFGLGGTISSLLGRTPILTVSNITLLLCAIASFSFVMCVILVKNRPKVAIETKKRVQLKHIKDLWRQKFTAYNIIVVSVFLGVSWTFLSQFENFQKSFADQVAILNLAWILSGALFGILMSFIMQKWLGKTGDYKYYDRSCKIILFIGILGNLMIGILVQLDVEEFGYYVFAVFLIGIGTIGFFGLAYLSIIESMYPVPSLLIGTLIALFASIYSIISLAVSQLFPTYINPYFSIAAVTFMPWVYYVLTFETNFKRYKYYLNEKESKFQYLKIEDTMSEKTNED